MVWTKCRSLFLLALLAAAAVTIHPIYAFSTQHQQQNRRSRDTTYQGSFGRRSSISYTTSTVRKTNHPLHPTIHTISTSSKSPAGRTTTTSLNLIPDVPHNVFHELATTFSSTFSVATEGGGDSALTALGNDIFTFLVVSVVVVPLCKFLKVSPVLGFLAVGCAIGPFGLQLFSNNEADLELGDFGILFLLFNEGLSLSPERIQKMGRFTGLGVFQLVFSIGLIFIGTFWGGPYILQYVQELGIPLDMKLLRPIVENPVESFCIASAGALSSSAFVLPVLKQKKWEDRAEGIAGLSILLLQDLAVAPLLVVLPLLAGSGPSTSMDLGLLIAKATVGFGLVLVIGSYVLRYVFDIVAAARSTETFVAATLLVAVGMGQAADLLGLSATTGAFAAGVLLAGNKYRAQIQADIKPFEGILLGVFFITAGAGLDPYLAINQWATLALGIAAFILVKAAILFAAGPGLGLTKGQSARVALTLSGGGEFALVLFTLAQDLGIIPNALVKLLVASVIISMSLTPLLGEVGDAVANWLEASENTVREDGLTLEEELELFQKIDKDNSGSIELEELRGALIKLNFPYVAIAEVFHKFDQDGNGIIDADEWKIGIEAGILNDALNANSSEALSNTEIKFQKDALVICGYGEVGRSLYKLLAGSDDYGSNQGSVVCFDSNPTRVTNGVLSGEPVVFGDGANIDLLKAVGVTEPRAVILSYTSDSRRLDSTMRLRGCLPSDTPLFVYEGNSRIGRKLLDAGATEIISETTETVLRIGSLLGIAETSDDLMRLRQLSMEDFAMDETDDGGDVSVNGLSANIVADLAEELGCTMNDISVLWEDFRSVSSGQTSVPIAELKELVMRQADDGPMDGEALQACMSIADEDGEGELTFAQYARATWTECQLEE